MKKGINLSKIKRIHFTGIKGVGMTALALCAKDLGIKVSGSDIGEYFVTDETLKRAGINWQVGFSPNNLSNPDLLVFTAAHEGEKNVEVIEAKRQGIPVLSHGQALGIFMEGKTGISVCGVGGKTTTASMIATIFEETSLHPSFAIGVGNIDSLGTPGRYDKKGKYFIAEADEYFASPQDSTPRFFYQNPKIIVVTNIEFDHPDVYKNLDQTIETFQKFIKRIPSDGLIVACIDNPNVEKLLQLTKVPMETYGFSPRATWQITSINQSKRKTKFSLKHKDLIINNLTLSVPGRFNVRNATASLIVASFCGIPMNKIKKGLAKFKGTKRRFEFIKEVGKIKLFDDYAHHPTEIKATLKAAKSWFRGERIIAIFQPHTYSRTKALLFEFSKSFADADKVYIVPIYASAREKNNLGMSGEKLTKEIKKHHPNVNFIMDRTELIEKLKEEAKKGGVVFTLGAGDIFTWHDTIIKNLRLKVKNCNAKFEIKKNVRLAPYTTFNIGGPADYFCEAKTKNEIVEAVQWAKENNLDYFVLGGGSNILISDKGIRGLVIKVKNSKLKVKNYQITAEAGVSLAKLLQYATDHSLSGLEFLIGIPGTVGGAIVGNAGTKKGSISQVVEKVIVLGEDSKIYSLSAKECQFDYRKSRFLKSKEVVLEATFNLRKEKPAIIKKKVNEVLKTRKNQPKGKSAGCVFKNPRLAPVGYLIENAGLKGLRIGEAMISKEHGNFIINLGNASAADVLKLISVIKKKVKESFKVNLEEEIRLIGDFGG